MKNIKKSEIVFTHLDEDDDVKGLTSFSKFLEDVFPYNLAEMKPVNSKEMLF